MKRVIFGILASVALTLVAVPNAQACGGYRVQIDPVQQAISVAVYEHFQKVRRSVQYRSITNVLYDTSTAQATVGFVDRNDRNFVQTVRLALRGDVWVVVGGGRPARV